eukprot:gene14701-15631_t
MRLQAAVAQPQADWQTSRSSPESEAVHTFLMHWNFEEGVGGGAGGDGPPFVIL